MTRPFSSSEVRALHAERRCDGAHEGQVKCLGWAFPATRAAAGLQLVYNPRQKYSKIAEELMQLHYPASWAVSHKLQMARLPTGPGLGGPQKDILILQESRSNAMHLPCTFRWCIMLGIVYYVTFKIKLSYR